MPIAWHQSRFWDWCIPEDEKQEIEKTFLTAWFAFCPKDYQKNSLGIYNKDVEIFSKRGYN